MFIRSIKSMNNITSSKRAYAKDILFAQKLRETLLGIREIFENSRLSNCLAL